MDRFWAKVDRSAGPDECWPWTAAKFTRSPYGAFKWNGQVWRAHRVVWILIHGPIPDGLQVLHRCDNPPCCNPRHLWLGTHDDNMADRLAKGRY